MFKAVMRLILMARFSMISSHYLFWGYFRYLLYSKTCQAWQEFVAVQREEKEKLQLAIRFGMYDIILIIF